ncbi:MAG: TIGR03619 family F420-dependent LLM class oxidoreductase [Alphaproteobacteria bacterium]|nr:TIGR03619 family F420-dependent LLM class oxidoreductase [Alphaproteobacteria bacterium]MCY4319248.1 TIGR03619 family F420-dependent LLM class oxidoreductase [Alphaproteobacteria bacterium]
MEFGLSIPNRGPLATPEAIRALAEKAEESGFVRLAVSDHIVIPKHYASRYPYDASGKLAGDWGDCMEQLILMTHVAAVTHKARILSAVMVVPHRPAVFTAKAVATMDVLSGGRIDLGVGAGWLREEFEAVGAPDFDARGRVTNEFLEAFKTLWTAEVPTMAGEFAAFDGIVFDPKPVQRPHPPIWAGGESGPALRRAARHADVWFPIGANPRHPLDTPVRFAAGAARMRAEAEKAGRDPTEIGLAFSANWYREDLSRQNDEDDRFLFTGSDEQVAEDVIALHEIGVERLMFNFLRPSLEETFAAIDRFRENVMARVMS